MGTHVTSNIMYVYLQKRPLRPSSGLLGVLNISEAALVIVLSEIAGNFVSL